MAEGKKSFIAYSDWNGMFQALPDEVAGKLIKHIFLYVNDQNPSTDDYVINALFEQVKSTLKRDLKKWERQTQQRVEAGKKSAKVRLTKINERSTVVKSRQRKPTDSVSDSVNVNDNVNTYRAFAHLSLSVHDANKLIETYDKTKLDKILDSIENYSKNKNYKNLYLTAKNWLEKEYPAKTIDYVIINSSDFIPKN